MITIGNVCFIQNLDKTETLLLLRNGESMNGLWAGVGGKTHFDEDIHDSCIREVKEETGLLVEDLTLKGVLKTFLDKNENAWILFVYTAVSSEKKTAYCDEGELKWVKREDIYDYNLVGFLREILPHVLKEDIFLEGSIIHDIQGNVLEKNMHITSLPTHQLL